MKVFLLLSLLVFSSSQENSSIIKHPFINIGSYEVANETVIKYFYSSDIHASWSKAVELCKIFEMQLVIFKDDAEEKNFKEKFGKFFAGRDSYIFIGANTTKPGSKTEWKWTNGEKINYELKWGETEPSNTGNKEFCLCFDENDPLLYHDISCEVEYPFVCQEIWNYERILVKKTNY